MAEDIVGKIELTGKEAFVDAFVSTVAQAVQKGQAAGQAALQRSGAGGGSGAIVKWQAPLAALQERDIAIYKKHELAIRQVGFAFNEIKPKALSVTDQIKLINAKAQEAHQRFGVMANAVTGASTTLRLLGLEAGFAAVETGRMVLYLGRATTSAGGLAAGVKIIAAATAGFLKSIGPIGWALTAATAAWLAVTSATKKYKDAQEEAEKANRASLDTLRTYNDELQRSLGLKEEAAGRIPAGTTERGKQISELEQKIAADLPLPMSAAEVAEDIESRIRAYMRSSMSREMGTVVGLSREEAEKRAVEDFNASSRGRELASALEARARRITEGTAAIDAAMRAKIETKAIEAGRKLESPKISGFKIGGIDAMRTRFGNVNLGTKFGEQTEPERQIGELKKISASTKKTEEILRRMEAQHGGGIMN